MGERKVPAEPDGQATDDTTPSARPWVTSRRVWRIVGGVGVVVAFAIAVVAGAVLALDQSLSRVDVHGLSGGPAASFDPDDHDAEGDEDDGEASDDPSTVRTAPDEAQLDRDAPPVTILVLGSDSREVLTPEERTELGTGMAWGERTEVVALVRIDADADELRMVNIPRDSVVTRCDGTRGRINAAHSIGERTDLGGMSCVVQTVSEWSGVDIDHAVTVDFRGFLEIVDAIGGIEMYLEEPLQDERANLDLEAGCQVLDGADALAFVRARHIDDDFGRISRQQRLLVEMRDQVSENGVLSDPVRALRFAEAVASSLQVDSTLTLNRIRHLVMDHRRTAQLPLDARTVPGTPDTSGAAWLLQPDEDAAAELFTWLIDGDPEPDGDTEAAGDGTGPSDRDPDAVADGPEDDAVDDAPAGSRPRRCG